jgi:rod shape-determining protein MreD
LQDALDDSFSDGKIPDVALLLVVFLAVRYDTSHSLVVGFILGILRDTWTIAYFGTNSVILVLAGYFPHIGRKHLNMSSLYTQWVILLLATIGAGVVRTLIYWGLGKTFTPAWETVLRQVLLHSVLFWPLRWVWDRTLSPFRPPEGKRLFMK